MIFNAQQREAHLRRSILCWLYDEDFACPRDYVCAQRLLQDHQETFENKFESEQEFRVILSCLVDQGWIEEIDGRTLLKELRCVKVRVTEAFLLLAKAIRYLHRCSRQRRGGKSA